MGLVLSAARNAGDLVRHVLPLNDFSEDGVVARKPGCRSRSDKELRAIGVGPGISHREFSRLVELMRRAFGLVLELVTGAAHAGAGRIATLDHEVGDHAMEDGSVVQPVFALVARHRMSPLALALGKFGEVSDCLGRFFIEEAADDLPLAGIKRCVQSWLACHDAPSLENYFVIAVGFFLAAPLAFLVAGFAPVFPARTMVILLIFTGLKGRSPALGR